MKKKKIVSLFHFDSNIAGKDMFLVPMYLGRKLGYDIEFVYPTASFNKEYKNEYRGVKLTSIRSRSQYYCTLWSEKEMFWWLIKNARNIDVLSLFWLNARNMIFAKSYKKLNPKGVCYIKSDFNEVDILSLPTSITKGFKYKIKEWLYQSIDIVSVETKRTFWHLKKGALGNRLANIVEYVPNGFDEELCKEYDMKRVSFSSKENLIITVGRIGSKQKANEVMFDALDQVDMKNWKFVLIGPIEEDFKIKYNIFIERNPDKKDKVILLGSIGDKRRLWEWYNKAKVFILTSIYEGFPNVFPEALYFGNYIITTKLSAVYDITDNERIGKIVPIGNVKKLSIILQGIFEGDLPLESLYPKILKHSEIFSWNNTITPIVVRIKKKLCE